MEVGATTSTTSPDMTSSKEALSDPNDIVQQSPPATMAAEDDLEVPLETSSSTANNNARKKELMQRMYYWIAIGLGAMVGSTLRVFVGRLFGQDCEEGSVQDVFTSLFSKICITSGGKSLQTGGALFRDLPANLLGSFIMGFFTPHRHALFFPWWPKQHPLQNVPMVPPAITVGLCGCLTTFASWNTQMVVMMDGTYTVLGPSVVAALFGYMLGITGATASFSFGREVSHWTYCATAARTNSNREQLDHSDEQANQSVEDTSPACYTYLGICLFLFVGVVALLFVGATVYDVSFYRDLLLVNLLAPAGALTRWQLSTWNSSPRPPVLDQYFPWFPWGTLTANLGGAFVSIVCQALLDRFVDGDWSQAWLGALKVGFAGSLSTVSTFAKEIVGMQDKYTGEAKPFLYAMSTCFCGLFLGLILYMPMVRSG
eukprot:Nitzschia sp. Nitz4//scaffold114_size70088//55057//56429//NITZ4_005986-RA/size70088-augustus-gene-0.11-mRNA-1//-1//CDS//3329533450//6850//frame0